MLIAIIFEMLKTFNKCSEINYGRKTNLAQSFSLFLFITKEESLSWECRTLRRMHSDAARGSI